MSKWEVYSFEELIFDDTKNGNKVKKEDYLEDGLYPIIDQGQKQISGYRNTADGLYENIPAIIFGDHTRVIKYIDTPFFLGAEGVKILKSKRKDVSYKYLYYFFTKNEVPNTGYNRHFKWLKELSIPLPPLETQKQIAKTLDTASELLTMRKQQLAELDNLIKSIFNEMFGEYFGDRSYLMRLPEICNFIDYRGKTPEKSEHGIPLITAKNIKNNIFSIEPKEYISTETYKAIMTRGYPEVNNIIFTTEAPLGNVCRIPNIFEKFAVGQRIIVMQPFKNMVVPEYMEFALTSKEFQNKVLNRSSGSTVRGIRSKELAQLSIPVPPLSLQAQFASIVNKIEEQKALVQKVIDETQYLLDSLMSGYFDE